MSTLLDKKKPSCPTVPSGKPLAVFVRKQTMIYGVNRSELPGLLATVLGGRIRDETLNALMGKNIRELSQMTPEELGCLPGISKTRSIRLAAAFELARRLTASQPEVRPSIRCPEDASRLVMEEMRHLDRENFRAMLLNTRNQVIAIESVSVGNLNSCTVHPREVFKNAVKKSAASIILVHNHPSGDPAPSQEDIQLTKHLIEAGSILGIQILDHIIIGDGRFASLKARGDIKC